MTTTIVCCQTIRDEIELAMQQTSCTYPIIWIQSGLHNFPDKLRSRLQETLDGIIGFDRVILGFGFCGNALAQLKTRDFELIIPRVDDCITLLLGSSARRSTLDRTYFLTKGWLEGETNIWKEYEYALKKYGKEDCKDIFDMMLKNYTDLGILDTGGYDIETFSTATQHIAHELGLAHTLIPASVDYLRELLKGPWPQERFITVPPNTELQPRELTVSG